jgi:DMSO/TMAO reductase YedYZ heme-binding membrane subunit
VGWGADRGAVILNTLPWYIARASGLVGWALLTASVIWGLAISTKAKPMGRRPRPAWMLDLHRYLGGLATIFTAVHVAGIVADTYVSFDLASVLVPFASSWRPVAVGWGVVGMYLLAAVELTSLARKRLPRKVWRATHFASFPLFISATAHAVTDGTDTGAVVFEMIAAVSVSVIGGLTALRIDQSRRKLAPVVPIRRERAAA